MTDQIKKETPVVTIPPATPPKPKRHVSGIEPGSLGGGSYSVHTRQEPESDDDGVLKIIKGMTGNELRRWLKVGGNKEALDRALANRGNKQ